MDSAPKISFNNQVVNQGPETTGGGNSGFNISPYKRIIGLVKEEDANGLKNFLDSLESPAQYINQTDKDLNQTPIYNAVQIKNRTVGYSITNLLLQNGVGLFFNKPFIWPPHPPSN